MNNLLHIQQKGIDCISVLKEHNESTKSVEQKSDEIGRTSLNLKATNYDL